MIAAAQTLDNGFLGDRLTVAHAHQLTACALAVDGKTGVFTDEVFPRERANALKKLFKAPRFKPTDDKQNSVGTARVQIGGEGVFKCAEKARAAVFGFGVDAQTRKLASDNAFQTERGGCNPFVSFHIFLR